MENNNGRGIFYGVIGVATLVVAIIGATFAYFSASAANNNAIRVGTTSVSLSLDDEEYNFYTDLIPVDAENQYFAAYPGLTALSPDKSNKGKGTCTDDLGNSICGVYQFTITNPTTVAQTVYGSIEVKSTTFPLNTETNLTNISYAVFKGEASTVAGSADKFKVNGTAKPVTDSGDGFLVVSASALGTDTVHNKANSEWSNTAQTLAPGTAQTYTIVVWLQEAGANNAGDQNKLFTAAVKFDTSAGGSGVTGVLSAAAAQEPDPTPGPEGGE